MTLTPLLVLPTAALHRQISDFGLSALSSDIAGSGGELLHTTCGTPNYVSPEVLLGGNDQKGYDGRAADIWSSGVILYVLLAGFLPFDESSMVELFRKIVKADFAYPSTLSPEAISLLSIILNPDPVKRATMDDIRESAWYRGLTLEQAEQERIKEEEEWRIAEAQQRAAHAAAIAAADADAAAARAQEQQQLQITANGTALPAASASSSAAGAVPAVSSSSAFLLAPPLTAAQKRASFSGNGDQPPPPIQGDVSLAITWLADDKSKQLAASAAAAGTAAGAGTAGTASAGTSAPSSSPASPASAPLSAPPGTSGGGNSGGGTGGAAMLLQAGGSFSPKVSPALSPAMHAHAHGHGPSALSLANGGGGGGGGGGLGVASSPSAAAANGSPSAAGNSLQARRGVSRVLSSSAGGDGAGAGAGGDSNDPLALDEDEVEIRGPIPLNAFDLINMVGGAAMGRMFQRGSEKKVRTFTQFTSPMKLEDILHKLQEVLSQCSETQFRIYPKVRSRDTTRNTSVASLGGLSLMCVRVVATFSFLLCSNVSPKPVVALRAVRFSARVKST